jgi:hypothetical protein
VFLVQMSTYPTAIQQRGISIRIIFFAKSVMFSLIFWNAKPLGSPVFTGRLLRVCPNFLLCKSMRHRVSNNPELLNDHG